MVTLCPEDTDVVLLENLRCCAELVYNVVAHTQGVYVSMSSCTDSSGKLDLWNASHRFSEHETTNGLSVER